MSKITVLSDKEKLLRKIEVAIRIAPDTDIEYPEGSKDLKWPEDISKMYKDHIEDKWYPKAEPTTPKIVFTAGNLTLKVFKTKKILTELLKRVEKMPATMVAKKELPTRATLKKPPSPNRQVVGDLIKDMPEGIFTDAKVLCKGTPPGRIKWDEERSPLKDPESIVSNILDVQTEPAELSYYVIVDEDDIGVSRDPIVQLIDIGDKPSMNDNRPYVVFRCGGKFAVYSQYRLNVIRKRYPDAKYGMATSGQLIAYEERSEEDGGGRQPVASIMCINMSEDKTGYLFTLVDPPGQDMALELGLLKKEYTTAEG